MKVLFLGGAGDMAVSMVDLMKVEAVTSKRSWTPDSVRLTC